MSDYNRLTKWREDGRAVLAKECCDSIEFQAERIKVFNRLAEYEDKIEQGTLIELPCKVGDTLYYANIYAPTPRVEENIVHTIEMFNARDGFNIRIWTQHGTFYANSMPNVFKNREDAEKRLKEMQNGKAKAD